MKTPPCLTTFKKMPPGVLMSHDPKVLEVQDPEINARIWVPPWTRETKRALETATLESLRVNNKQLPWATSPDGDEDTQDADMTCGQLRGREVAVWRKALPSNPAYNQVAECVGECTAAFLRHRSPHEEVGLMSIADNYRGSSMPEHKLVTHVDHNAKAFFNFSGSTTVGLPTHSRGVEAHVPNLNLMQNAERLFSVPRHSLTIWNVLDGEQGYYPFHHAWPVTGDGKVRHTGQVYVKHEM